MNKDAFIEILNNALRVKKYSPLIAPIPALIFTLLIILIDSDFFQTRIELETVLFALFFIFIAALSMFSQKKLFNRKLRYMNQLENDPTGLIKELQENVHEQDEETSKWKQIQGVSLEKQLLLSLGKIKPEHNLNEAKNQFISKIKKMYAMRNMVLPISFAATMMFPALYLIIEGPVVDDYFWFLFIGFGAIFVGIAIPVIIAQAKGRKILENLDENPEIVKDILQKTMNKRQRNKFLEKAIRQQQIMQMEEIILLFDTFTTDITIADHPEDY